MESVATVNGLIGETVQHIKAALNCPSSWWYIYIYIKNTKKLGQVFFNFFLYIYYIFLNMVSEPERVYFVLVVVINMREKRS
jgi:hypothetical protein